MRSSPRFTLSAAYLGCLLLAACAVDDRSLQGIAVWVAGSAGEVGVGATSGEAGDAGGDSGGDAGASGSAGTGTGGTGAIGGTAGGSSGKAGSAGSAPIGGSGGKSGAGGVCGCGGEGSPPRCPDIDGNHVLDCDETLAKNGSFDDDVSNWMNDSGVASSWRDIDSHDGDDSGSLALEIQTVADQDGNVMLGTRQCFSAAGGAVYYYGVEISVPESAEDYRAGFQLLIHDSPACSGQPVDKVDSNYIEGSSWSVAQITYLTPTSTKSIALRLIAIKPFRAEPVNVRFDNVLVRTD